MYDAYLPDGKSQETLNNKNPDKNTFLTEEQTEGLDGLAAMGDDTPDFEAAMANMPPMAGAMEAAAVGMATTAPLDAIDNLLQPTTGQQASSTSVGRIAQTNLDAGITDPKDTYEKAATEIGTDGVANSDNGHDLAVAQKAAEAAMTTPAAENTTTPTAETAATDLQVEATTAAAIAQAATEQAASDSPNALASQDRAKKLNEATQGAVAQLESVANEVGSATTTNINQGIADIKNTIKENADTLEAAIATEQPKTEATPVADGGNSENIPIIGGNAAPAQKDISGPNPAPIVELVPGGMNAAAIKAIKEEQGGQGGQRQATGAEDLGSTYLAAA